jgi:hypothetical protein
MKENLLNKKTRTCPQGGYAKTCLLKPDSNANLKNATAKNGFEFLSQT